MPSVKNVFLRDSKTGQLVDGGMYVDGQKGNLVDSRATNGGHMNFGNFTSEGITFQASAPKHEVRWGYIVSDPEQADGGKFLLEADPLTIALDPR